jgi:endonuclease YncB( thermonuclease family)
MAVIVYLLVFTGAWWSSDLVWPHAGVLDEYGCHAAGKERGYHCHQGTLAGQSFRSRTDMLSARMDSYTGFPPQVAIEQFSAQVVEIWAGDRISVLYNGRPKKVRLSDVVCPRKGRPYAKEARRFTWFMVSNRDVLVTVVGRDHDGQMVAEVKLRDGRVLNREIIREGLGWASRKASRDKTLGDLQSVARAERRGMWADPQADSFPDTP